MNNFSWHTTHCIFFGIIYFCTVEGRSAPILHAPTAVPTRGLTSDDLHSPGSLVPPQSARLLRTVLREGDGRTGEQTNQKRLAALFGHNKTCLAMRPCPPLPIEQQGQGRNKCCPRPIVHAHPGPRSRNYARRPQQHRSTHRITDPQIASRRIREPHRVTHGEQRSRATGTRAAHRPGSGSSATSSRPAPLAAGASLPRLFCASTARRPPTNVDPFPASASAGDTTG